MKQFIAYLAGPITGCTFETCTDWRENITAQLVPQILCMSPMRGKTHLKQLATMPDQSNLSLLSGPKQIVTRDFNDCRRADLIIVNLLGSTKVSIGTVMEIAWAKAFNVPVILMMEDNNIHQHSMLVECCGFRASTIDEAVFLAKTILLP